MASWGADLEERLTSSAWVANTGLPLVVTLVGIFVAVYLVKRQIRNDRNMRNADRSLERIRPLSSGLSDAGDRLQRETGSSFWTASVWPDQAMLVDGIQRAMGTLTPEARRTITRAVSTVSSIWAQLAFDPQRADADSHGVALRTTLVPLAIALQDVGAELDRWSGEKKLPELLRNRSDLFDADLDRWQTTYQKILDSGT